MAYKLSATLSGHSSDVRGLVSQGSDLLVSVSYDQTAKIWKRASPNVFADDATLIGHQKSVNSVTIIPSSPSLPSGAIATGSSDKNILLWDPTDLSHPLDTLTGHESTVCGLAASSDGMVLVSGSWDKTAKVWVDGKCKHTLRGHEQAVWAVLVLDDGSILTGSADKAICRWVDGTLKQKYQGHTDCVRALAALPDGRFASAGNDCTVRIWSLDGSCEAVLQGHTSFIYSLSVLPSGAIVSGGEDRSVRVWKNSEPEHVIMVPATSVWAVAALDNGDVACGTSDGRVRVFSTDAARLASPEALMLFESENSSFAMSKKTMDNMDMSKLPGPERLERPGTKDQQVIMVKSGTVVEAFQWSKSDDRWIKIGQVVDAAGQTQKKMFDGKEYDYVFDVDIQEGMPPLKLPYNVTENPYSAAQRFLEKNQLSLEHLDTVADFITKNADGVQLGGSEQTSYADPFTGGSRYVPGQPGGNGQAGSGPADPFTGGSRYVPGTSGAQAGSGSAAASSSGFNPPSSFVINRQGNAAAIVKKLGEFNEQMTQTSELALDTAQIMAIQDLASRLSNSETGVNVDEAAYGALLKAAIVWPKEKRFPALDLLRLVVASCSLPLTFMFNNQGFIQCVDQASGFFTLLGESSVKEGLSKEDEINLMMAARSLSNALASEKGAEVLWESRKMVLDALDGSWIQASNKNLVTALSALYLNMAILTAKRGDDDLGLNILSAASRFLSSTSNADAQTRLLSVFGVLAKRFQLCKDSARILGDEVIVILGIQGKTDGVRRAARELGDFLR
ncbi:WD repeat protein Lub1 [Coemansia sp. RSA 2599]|nr:WD repeat protein Lub1 [Coemansia sp. RSA 2598]KAJ1829430.1 WD repeat protein Lub1 [Coemansia sp. RSA 2599]